MIVSAARCGRSSENKMPDWLKFGRKADSLDARFSKDTPLGEVRYAVVDTELTSLNTKSNRLLSIGAIAMDGAKIRMAEQFYTW